MIDTCVPSAVATSSSTRGTTGLEQSFACSLKRVTVSCCFHTKMAEIL